ncbi:MAG: TetR/AcrR family transcriptional regulator, partial [Actinomycetota bacterium]|nr:TetR/AcrR family transcriptional regulator [Actinomycetota bacterium]
MLGAVAVKQGVYRGQSAEERSAERRARLLEATLEVWGSLDGPPVTMTRICQQAGLTERYFYEQFTGLEAALTAVLESIYEEILDVTSRAVEETEGGPAERAHAAVAAFVGLFVDDPRKGRAAMILAPSRPTLRARRQAMLKGLADFAEVEALELYGDEAELGNAGVLAAMLFVGGLSELV